MSSKNRRPIAPLMTRCGFPQFLFMRLLAVYFLLSDITILYAGRKNISARKNWQAFIRLFPLPVLILLYLLLLAGVTLLYYACSKKRKTAAEVLDPALLVLSVLLFSCFLVWQGDDFYLSVLVGLFSLIFVVYGLSRIRPELLTRNKKDYTVILPVAVLSVAVFFFLCETSLAIHRTYGTTTFDMGIFGQAFHGLSRRGYPLTTCERGYALSHFRVHASFILYLLTPVYAIFPSVETLIVSQAALVVSGVIPVYLIARKKGFGGTALLSCCVIYLFSLGILSPCYYHFHENAFLPPLLMWLFYAVESRRNILFYVMSAMVCLVKEDATLFVICICLYLAFELKGKDRIRVLITGGAATVYFLMMSAFLSKAGEGNMMMSSRMHTLMTEENQGALSILGNILTNPGHALTVATSEPEGFLILLEMLLPLLLTPFLTKKAHRFFLMVPFFIFNLMFSAAYVYAAQIQYQYAFGTATLLCYLALININDLNKDKRPVVLPAVAAMSVICAVCMLSANMKTHDKYKENRARFDAIENCLKSIPQDASVTANTYYLPHLTARDEIYELGNDNFVMSGSHVIALENVNATDYYVLNLQDRREAGAAEYLKSKGYTQVAGFEEYIAVYAHPNDPETH